MTSLHAYGFLLLGAVLRVLPVVAPGYFPPATLDSANTSALWLQLMAWVSAGLGAGFVVRLQVLPALARALAWRPSLPPAMQPAELLRPALDLYKELGTVHVERKRRAVA